MKRRSVLLAVCAAVLCLCLAGCAGDICIRADGIHRYERADLLFVCETERPVGAVGVSTGAEAAMTGNANRTHLRWGETVGFGVHEWPATVSVFSDLEGRREVARVRIGKAPPAGERWVVAAVDGGGGVALAVSSQPIHNGPAALEG